jgi:curved DNA-binding protein CbpA
LEEKKSQYSGLIKINHPDHGGANEMAIKINNAYDLLKNYRKRRIKRKDCWRKLSSRFFFAVDHFLLLVYRLGDFQGNYAIILVTIVNLL